MVYFIYYQGLYSGNGLRLFRFEKFKASGFQTFSQRLPIHFGKGLAYSCFTQQHFLEGYAKSAQFIFYRGDTPRTNHVFDVESIMGTVH
jgi:hypothetical protein